MVNLTLWLVNLRVCSITLLSTCHISKDSQRSGIGSKIAFQSKQVNSLKQKVDEEHLDRRSVCWKEVDEVTDFPQLDEEQLRALTCGYYQLRLAPSYTQKHINGECPTQVHNEDQWRFIHYLEFKF